MRDRHAILLVLAGTICLSLLTAADGAWTLLTSDDFEAGWGDWVDGGSDAALSAAHSVGTQCLELRDNSGEAASAWMGRSLDLTGYARLKVAFTYVAVSFEGAEDFWVQFSDDNVYIDNVVVSAEGEDSDADGLPDGWEREQFGDLATSGGGTDNFDSDLNTDFEEYHAGTMATNPASFFQVSVAAAGGGTLGITFDGKVARSYVLELTDGLSPSNTWGYCDGVGPLLSSGPRTLSGTVAGDPPSVFGRIRYSADPLDSPSARFVPEGYAFVWGDHFGGTSLDTSKWFVGMRDPVSGDLIPGAQGDYLLNDKYAGYVTGEDSFVEEGRLILRNQRRPFTGSSPAGSYNYTSGWVTSMHRGYFNKGYVEVRAKFPSGDKVWPAIWLIAEDLVWGPEWDLWEYFGYRASLSPAFDNMGTHLMTGPWSNQKWDSNWLASFDAVYDCEAWHVYGWEWTDTRAVWSIDGVVVHTLERSATKDPAAWPDEGMYIVLNNGVRTASPDTNTTWPNQLEIDYIEVYQELLP